MVDYFNAHTPRSEAHHQSARPLRTELPRIDPEYGASAPTLGCRANGTPIQIRKTIEAKDSRPGARTLTKPSPSRSIRSYRTLGRHLCVHCHGPAQNPGRLEIRLEPSGRTEQEGLDPQYGGRVEVLLHVVDHQRRPGGQTEAVEQSHEDGRLRLRHTFATGDDGAVEAAEERETLEAERIGLRLHVGHGVTGHPGLSDRPQHLHGSGKDTTDHLLAAARPCLDLLGELWISGGQLGTRRRGGDASVVRCVPCRRTHLAEEALHLRLVREQPAIEVPGVPIEQDATDVEDHGLDRSAPIYHV